MSSTPSACDQAARDRVGAEQYRITQLEQQVEDLLRALQTRDAIGQARGILLSRYPLGPDQAFALLVRLSQSTDIKLVEVAAAFVTRMRDRGSADPRSYQLVTEVVDELLGSSGQGEGDAGVAGTARRSALTATRQVVYVASDRAGAVSPVPATL
ncbi:ANTAR domain-containing protein [Pseudonocardia sp. KRD291]|uniref:ANTAR domain-containing protein n=1 Tax=Pseudonocardia sp. KRD291 TaxID=2792007 RepID=UPI001C4A6206|nr:ANTAR domain-containing protein [Pseudonocardia sp. KRD291]MBW0100876.1 ANTAR domain-containing protein [Pseudonocardia sp. KRD291]